MHNDTILRITGGLGLPSKNYAGFSFKPHEIEPDGLHVRSFIGNHIDADWQKMRLESGMYAVQVERI